MAKLILAIALEIPVTFSLQIKQLRNSVQLNLVSKPLSETVRLMLGAALNRSKHYHQFYFHISVQPWRLLTEFTTRKVVMYLLT